MQAGALQHTIELQRPTDIISASGHVSRTWTTYATGRAALRQSGISEFLTTFGEGVTDNAVFLIRYLHGVTVADRILHKGKMWNIVAIAEIGRRKGLELRAVAA